MTLAGAEVGRLELGTMSLTGRGTWGSPADPAGARALLRREAELGVQLFDTADSYDPDTAENLLREALHPYDGLLVATKGGFRRHGPHEWSGFLAGAAATLARVARAHAATSAQVALAWLLLRSPRLAVIPGTASIPHLEENVAAGAFRLEPAELAALERERLWTYRAKRVAGRARIHAGRARRALRGRAR